MGQCNRNLFLLSLPRLACELNYLIIIKFVVVFFSFCSKNSGDHVEVIAIDFDPTEVSYYELLGLFWNNHEYGLTTRVKRQYASLIQYHTETQREVAEKSLDEERKNRVGEVIITTIEKVSVFYPAEE